MNYNIRGENIEVTRPIREYVEKKIGKLNKYFDTPPTCDVHVNLSVYNEEQQIEVTIPMTNLLLRAEEQRSEERRVGKECRTRRQQNDEKKKKHKQITTKTNASTE